MKSTEIRWAEADWIYVAENRDNWCVCVCVCVCVCEHGYELSGSTKCG